MQHDRDDIPRLPDEDVVDRATEIPDIAHDDQREDVDAFDDDEDVSDDASEGPDLDPERTD